MSRHLFCFPWQRNRDLSHVLILPRLDSARMTERRAALEALIK